MKNEVLDVKKFADTAKNEAFQNPDLVTRSLLIEGSATAADPFGNLKRLVLGRIVLRASQPRAD